jgi:catechol 2,3-dioxygenase-like lactoylglutathione lyase family enzyme
MILGIDHVHVAAADMDKTIDFYTNKLGFRFLRRLSFGPPDARRELAYVGLGDLLLELLPPGPMAASNRPFALTVNEIEKTVEELRSKGVEVKEEVRDSFSFNGLTAVIKDPSGLDIELRQWAAPDGPHYADWQPARPDVVRTA